jgi:hypothetical protein
MNGHSSRTIGTIFRLGSFPLAAVLLHAMQVVWSDLIVITSDAPVLFSSLPAELRGLIQNDALMDSALPVTVLSLLIFCYLICMGATIVLDNPILVAVLATQSQIWMVCLSFYWIAMLQRLGARYAMGEIDRLSYRVEITFILLVVAPLASEIFVRYRNRSTHSRPCQQPLNEK